MNRYCIEFYDSDAWNQSALVFASIEEAQYYIEKHPDCLQSVNLKTGRKMGLRPRKVKV